MRLIPAKKNRPSAIEPLEARIAPAYTATLVGTMVTFTDAAGAADTLTFDAIGGFLHHNRFTAGDVAFASDFDMVSGDGATVTMLATTAAFTVIVNAGDMNDTVNIGTVANAAAVSLNNGTFTLHGETHAASDVLVIENSSDAAAKTVAISSTAVTFTGGPLVNYDTFESLTVNTGTVGDVVNVVSTLAAVTLTTVNTGGGTDTINVSSNAPTNTGNLDGIAGTLMIDAGAGSNTLAVSDFSSSTTNSNVVVTSSAITGFAGAADGVTINYSATGGGTFGGGITLSGSNTSGDVFNVQGTLTGATTTINSNGGNDTINVSSNAPTNTGNLDALAGTLTIDAGAGSNTLAVSDFSSATANSNVVVTSSAISGFAGAADGTTINYSATGGGSFGGGISLSGSNTSGDVFNVQSTLTGATTTLNGNAGNDTINVSSNAPTNTGNLDAILGTLTIDAGAGSNTLAVSDFGGATANSNVVVTNNAISGFAGLADGITINYSATGGGSFGGGISLLGSNTSGDVFNVQSTLTGATTTINGNGGNDTVNVSSNAPTNTGNLDAIVGTLTIDLGAGSNTLAVSDFGSATANNNVVVTSSAISGFAGAADGTTINYLATGGSFGGGITLSGSNTSGDVFNVQSTLTGGTTTINSNGGTDTINVSSNAPTNTGTLDAIAGTLTIDAGAGSNTLRVSDFGGATANGNVVVTSSAITGFAGAADGTTINYSATGGGSFGGGITLSGSNTSGDVFNVQSTLTGATTSINGNGGNDTINVSSNAPTNTGNLDAIVGTLTIDAGAGSNTLAVSDFSSVTANSNVVVTSSAITGFAGAADGTTINYSATSGSFGGGITLSGSNTNADVFNVQSTLTGGTTTINSNAGADTINVSSNAPTNTGNLDGILGTLTIDAGAGATNRLIVSDFGGATANSAVGVTNNAITGFAGTGDNVTINYAATGGTFTNGATNDGILLRGSNTSGDVFNVQSTLTGSTTKIEGNIGNDTFNVSSNAPTNSGSLDGILGTLTIDAGAGTTNRLIVSDFGGATANSAVVVTNSTITGFAGTGDNVAINYAATGGTFTNGATNDGILLRGSNTSGDVFNVQSTLTGSTTKIEGNAGNDTLNVSSDAPTNSGNLDGILGMLTIDAGAGATNRLIVSDFGGTTANSAVVVTNSAITGFAGTGDNVTINYAATGGNFTNGATNDGILLRGSNTSGDVFNVQSTLAGSTTKIEGNTGNDTFNVSSDAPTNSGTLDGILGTLTIDAGAGTTNRLIVSDFGGTTANSAVVVTNSAITGFAGTGDNVAINYAATGGTFTNGATNDGILLRGSNTSGDVFNVQSTLTGSTTKIEGNTGNDTFNVSSNAPTNSGTLDGILGMLTIDAGAGATNRLIVSDFGGTTANSAVVVTNSAITGFAGTGDNVTINYAATGGTFTNGATNDGILLRGSNTSGDVFNVQSTLTGSTTKIEGNTGNDTFNVSSDAPTNDGNLDGILGTLTIDAGAGTTNRLIVSDFGGATANSNVVLTESTIPNFKVISGFAGADNVDIHYAATGGTFTNGATLDGILLRGSNTSADIFNVRSTLTGSTTKIEGNVGNEGFNVSSDAPTNDGNLDGILGTLTIDAGAGTANRLIVSDFGGATANSNVVLTESTIPNFKVISGFAGADNVDIHYAATGGNFTNGATLDGILLRGSNTSADIFNVRSTLSGSTTKIEGNVGNEGFNVSSDAPTNDGNLDGILGTLTIDAGAGTANRLIVSDFGGATANSNVVLTESTIPNFKVISGFAGADNVDIHYAATGGTFTNGATLDGILLRGSNTSADIFNVRSTLTGSTTKIEGNVGNEGFNVSSDAPTNDGNLDGILGTLTIDAGAGTANRLIVSDFGGATANSNVVLTESTIPNFKVISGFAGADNVDINYMATGGNFTNGATLDGILLRGSNTSADIFNVRSTLSGSTTKIEGNVGNEGFNVSSDAPTNDGNLDGILGTLTIDAGAGTANRLIVSDFGGATANSNVVLTESTIPNFKVISGFAGADNVDINYMATGGNFTNGATLDGILLRGSNTSADIFNVRSTLSGSTTKIEGNTGNDTFNVSSDAPTNSGTLDGILGVLTIDAGAGTANRLIVSDFGGATANSNVVLTESTIPNFKVISGFAGADNVDIHYAATGGTFTNGATLDGILLRGSNTSADIFNVRSTLTGSTTKIEGNVGNEVFNVSSDAPTNDGNLDGILGTLTIDAGAGTANRLIVSDFGSATANSNVVLTESTIPNFKVISGFAGADNVDIHYAATGGNFTNGATLDGILLRGSNTSADVFNVRSTLGASTTKIEGNAGNDVFNISSDASNTGGTLVNAGNLDGILGTLTIDAGTGVGDPTMVPTNRLIVSDFGGATANSNVLVTTTAITGFAGATDSVTINYTATGGEFTNGATCDGILLRGSNTSADMFTVQGDFPVTTLKIQGNGGDDTFEISAWTGKGALDGGAGKDTIKAIKDMNLLLNDTRFATARLASAVQQLGPPDSKGKQKGLYLPFLVDYVQEGLDLKLNDLNVGLLTGGSAKNILDAGQFTGDTVLMGKGDVDILIAGKGNSKLYGYDDITPSGEPGLTVKQALLKDFDHYYLRDNPGGSVTQEIFATKYYSKKGAEGNVVSFRESSVPVTYTLPPVLKVDKNFNPVDNKNNPIAYVPDSQPAATGLTVKLSNGVLQHLEGSRGADKLTGNNILNTIWGGAGDDNLFGVGPDGLAGGDGNDKFFGVPKALTLEGDPVNTKFARQRVFLIGEALSKFNLTQVKPFASKTLFYYAPAVKYYPDNGSGQPEITGPGEAIFELRHV